MSGSPQSTRLTKVETVALWHAVENSRYMLRAMPESGCTPAQIDEEKQRLTLAKSALRKVNKLRKEGH